MFKNVASQKIIVFAFDETDNTPKTGDAAQITAKITKDYGSATALGDTNPTEIEDGYYAFNVTQTESNADVILVLPESSTADIQVVGCPATIFTRPQYFPDLGIESDGDLAVVTLTRSNTDMRGTDSAYTGTPPTATQIVDEWESQSQTDPTGFHVNVKEVNGTAQTANDNGADINAILVDTDELQGNQGNWATATGFATAAALSAHDGKLDTVDGIVDAILLDTAEIGTAGAGLTAVPWNAAWDVEVQSECADALNAYDPPTKAEMDTGFSGLNDLSAAEVNTQVDTALSDIHLDHLLAVDYDPASKPGTGTALLNELVENDSGVSRFTTNALENAPSGTGASAATIADAVWDEAKADHTAAGSFGETNQKVVPSETINDYKATGFSTHSAADVRTEMDSNSTQLAAILTDTGTTLDGKINDIDTVVDAIKLKTDNLPTDPADESLLEAKIDALNDVSSAEVNAACDTAISDYDPPTKAELDSGLAGLNDLSAAQVNAECDTALSDYDPPTKTEMDTGFSGLNDLSAAEVNAQCDTAISDASLATAASIAALNDFDPAADAVATVTDVTNQVTADVTAISGSSDAADNLEASAKTIVVAAATTGTLTTTAMTTTLTETTDDHYNGRIIIWTSGALKDQATDITDYTGATKLLTYTATTEAPSDGDTFVIV